MYISGITPIYDCADSRFKCDDKTTLGHCFEVTHRLSTMVVHCVVSHANVQFCAAIDGHHVIPCSPSVAAIIRNHAHFIRIFPVSASLLFNINMLPQSPPTNYETNFVRGHDNQSCATICKTSSTLTLPDQSIATFFALPFAATERPYPDLKSNTRRQGVLYLLFGDFVFRGLRIRRIWVRH